MKLIIDKKLVKNMLADGEEPQDYMKPFFDYVLKYNITLHQVVYDTYSNISLYHKGNNIYFGKFDRTTSLSNIIPSLSPIIQAHIRHIKIKKVLE